MGVAQPHHEVVAVGVPLAALEAVDHPRGNALCAQHHRQRGREVLAVAGAAHEEKVLERVLGAGTLEDAGVLQLAAEPAAQPQRGLVRIGGAGGDPLRQRDDPRGHRRQLGVARQPARVGRQPRVGEVQAARVARLGLGVHGVVQAGRRHGHRDRRQQ